MRISLLWLVAPFIICSSCKKPKPVLISGQLLLTKTHPVPLANQQVAISQMGGNAIIMGSSGSYASAVTDASGRFAMKFVPGSSYFIVFSGENNSPLSLYSFDAFPNFIRNNFPRDNDELQPIYVGKSIDTLIVKAYSYINLSTSDTIGISGKTIDAPFFKSYTGITADSASTFTVDTIYNALFTSFDCLQQTFRSEIQFGLLKTSTSTNSPYISSNYLIPAELSPVDEKKREMLFYISR